MLDDVAQTAVAFGKDGFDEADIRMIFLDLTLASRCFCFSRSSSMLSCPSNWKGVNGFGTKQAQEMDTLTERPFGRVGML